VKVGKRVRFSGELDIGSGGFLSFFLSFFRFSLVVFSLLFFSLLFLFRFRLVLLVLKDRVND